MFIQRKKVALLLLIFIAIPITIVFSAFKLSASKAAIAADENKTEYTLSDFGVAVPDDGIDFNLSSGKISGNVQSKESQVIKFSFAIKLLDLQAKKEIVVQFKILSFTFSISTNGNISVVMTNSNDSHIYDEYETTIECQANEVLTISFDVAYKNISAFSIECDGSKVSKEITNGSLSQASIQFKLFCQKGNNIKLFDIGTKPKSTSLTVKNESGDIVSSVGTKALTRSEIVKAVETEQKKFIGFEYESKLYKTADEIETINKNAVVTAKTMTLYMEYGARIRTIEPFGIRFAAVASYSAADYGIMLTTKDIAKNSDLFTLENLEKTRANVKIANKKQTQKEFNEIKDCNTGLSNFAIALVGTKGVRKANYNLVFAARAFAKIEYADGSVGTVYSNFGDDNCRSLYDVASKGLKNSNDKENHELYRDYCDGVIDITISKHESNILINMGYGSDLYSVKTTVENDNKILSITFANVKDGYDIADNVKCITINGKRIVGFKYDGGKIQIDITEFLS